MKNKKNNMRLLSVLLAFIMAFGFVPASVLALEGAHRDDYVSDGNYDVGDDDYYYEDYDMEEVPEYDYYEGYEEYEEHVEKVALAELIAKAQALERGNYTPTAWAALQLAIFEAEAIMYDEDATQDEVDKAIEDLFRAIEDKIIVDREGLVAAMAEAFSRDEDNYTPESWAALYLAMSQGAVVLGNAYATQNEIDAAAKSLWAALDALEEPEAIIELGASLLNVGFRITAPTGATAQVFRQGNFHQITPLELLHTEDLGNGMTEFGFPAGGTHYRVSMPGRITRTGFLQGLGGGVTVAFPDVLEDVRTQQHIHTSAMMNRMEASTMVNINTRNHLTLDVGQHHRLRGYRAAWEIIDGDTTNMIIQPDFHVNVLYGAHVIDIVPVPSQSNWFDITAQQPGTAIIEVCYDAIFNINRGNTALYAATNPVRTSVVVITAGGGAGTANFSRWDTEFDTVYYLNSQANGYFPFAADGGVTSVDVAHVLNGVLGPWQTVALEDNAYNVPVSAGNNIVRVMTSGGVDYQVVRAAQITPVLNNLARPGQNIDPGDRFTLRFEGLFAPAPKMANIYNPTLQFFGDPHGMIISYELNGTRASAGAQYTFINNHTMTFNAPNVDGHFEFMGGRFDTAIFAFITNFGDHRNIGDEGVIFRGFAPTLRRQSSILPNIPITVGAPVEIVDKTALDVAIAAALGRAQANYTPISWGAMQTALAAAQSVRDDAGATQSQVDTATANLNTAIGGLVRVADRAALNAAISAALGRTQTNYTPTSWAALETALGFAQDVYDNLNATQSQMDTAVTNLNAAIGGLVRVADRLMLNAAIADAQARIPTNYTTASWAAMQTALATAIGTRNNLDATQTEVDTAASSLRAAMSNLVEAIDRSALRNEIARAEGLIQAHFTSTSWAAMQTVLTEAIRVRDNTAATQNQVDTAAASLTAAINGLDRVGAHGRVFLRVEDPNARGGQQRIYFEGYIDIAPGETAYSILRRPETGLLIASSGHPAYGIYVSAINGWGEFSDGPLSGWMYAVNSVFPNYSSSLRVLRDGDRVCWLFTRDLGRDIGADLGANNITNRAELDRQIARAEGRTQANYTAASWAEMQTALAAARQMRNNPNASQTQIYNAANNLRRAIDNLVPLVAAPVDMTALDRAIEDAEGRTQANYTASSWAAMQTALRAARDVRNNPNATQTEVDDAAASLRAALNALTRVAIGGGGVDINLLTYQINRAESRVQSNYTPGSWAAMQAALTAARQVRDNANAIQAQINTVTNNLRAAIDGLVVHVEIVLPMQTADVAEAMDTGLTAQDIREIVQQGLSLTVHSDVASITFDVATLAGLVAGVANDIPVTIIMEANGNYINLSIMVGGNVVRNFTGIVTVMLPYSPNTPAEDHDLLTVYYIDADGNFHEMLGARYQGSRMIFNTSHFSTFFVSEWISPFGDVSRNDWYFRSVRFAYSSGLMGGVAVGQFAPNINLSRGMMVTMLWRLEGMPIAAEGKTFSDVAAGGWYAEAITWASANGIVSGYGNGLFGPHDSITREQLAVMLQNYAAFIGQNTEGGEFVATFADAGDIAPWAMDAMQWANANGLITGRTMSTLAPNGTATRAEMATIMQRFVDMR